MVPKSTMVSAPMEPDKSTAARNRHSVRSVSSSLVYGDSSQLSTTGVFLTMVIAGSLLLSNTGRSCC